MSQDMEKFTAFAHAATGVNPFLPRGTPMPLWQVVVMSPVVCLRVALLAVLLLLLAVVERVPGMRNVLVPLLAHLLLSSCGFFNAHHVENEPRRTGVQSRHPALDAPSPDAGDLAIVQYQSPVDVLICCLAFSLPDCFVFPAQDGRLLAVRSIFGALLVAASEQQPEIGNCDEIPRRAALFACGARTNGEALLAWPSLKGRVSGPCDLLGVQYDETVPFVPTRSSVRYLVELLASLTHQVRFTAVQGVATEAARAALCRVSGALRDCKVVETDLSASKAAEFRRFFDKSRVD